ncbi:MAG: hypothetical protein GXO79_07245, partial [Chlorobi bacterium]|nr:hypothetical protein [Chlorobiota bacterium]
MKVLRKILSTTLLVIFVVFTSFAGIPTITSIISIDTDNDGNIDALEIQFSEAINDNDFTVNALADWLVSSDSWTSNDQISGFNTSVTVIASNTTANDVYVRLTFSPVNVSGTAVVEYSYTNDGGDNITSISTSGILADIGQTAATDAAAPQITDFQYEDNDANGMIDQIVISFSETLNAASTLSANDLAFSNVGDFTAAAFGTNATDLITGAVSSATVILGTEATAITTAETSGNIAVSTQN